MATTTSGSGTFADKAKHFVSVHWASLWAGLWATPWPVWFIPVVGVLVILAIGATDYRWLVEKDNQEFVAPTTVGLAALMAVFTHRWVRETFTLILMLTVLSFFLRELHFNFTNGGIYFALFALAIWFSTVRLEMQDWLGHWWLRVWLGGAFLTYFVADMFDAHLWQFLPNYWSWNDIAEESLETLGHMQLFALVLISLKIGLTKVLATRR